LTRRASTAKSSTKMMTAHYFPTTIAGSNPMAPIRAIC
jgi:hypothetical protein